MLRLCPFCGGEAHIESMPGYDWPTYRAVCKDCRVQSNYSPNKEDVVDYWNRRAGDTEEMSA